MIWGAFSAYGKSSIAFIGTRLDSRGYQKILQDHLLPFMQKFPSVNHTFMQDNASIHASRSTSEWLRENKVETLPWPARSPDINPIENVWGLIVRDIYSDCRQYDNVAQLKTAIQEAWDRISPEILRNLVISMPNRMNLLIKSAGKPINY